MEKEVSGETWLKEDLRGVRKIVLECQRVRFTKQRSLSRRE